MPAGPEEGQGTREEAPRPVRGHLLFHIHVDPTFSWAWGSHTASLMGTPSSWAWDPTVNTVRTVFNRELHLGPVGMT